VQTDPVTGVLTYTPEPDFEGLEIFAYSVCDRFGRCDRSAVNVVVFPGIAGGLVGWWPLEDGGGPLALDASGHGQHGMVVEAVAVPARVGMGLDFDGVDDYVSVPDSDTLDVTGAITIAAWVKPAALESGMYNRTIIAGKPGAYQFGIGGNDFVHDELLFTLPDTWDVFSLGASVPAGRWTHVAVTFDGAEARFFVNGAQVSASLRSGAMAPSDLPLRLGDMAQWPDHAFRGSLDDVRLYGRALHPIEIGWVYQGTEP
jgi:hypothetical protein